MFWAVDVLDPKARTSMTRGKNFMQENFGLICVLYLFLGTLRSPDNQRAQALKPTIGKPPGLASLKGFPI